MFKIYEYFIEMSKIYEYYIEHIPAMIRYRILKFRIKCLLEIYKGEFGYRCWSFYLTPKQKVVEVGGFNEYQIANFHIVPIFDFYFIFPK